MATQSSAWTGEKPRKAGNGAGRGSAARSGEKVVPISPTGSAQDIHRTPPHSVEAEQGVLGSMLISPRETVAQCVKKINEEYFYGPAHRTIYNVLVDLWNAGQAIDLITFTQVLRDRNLLESVGGAAFVTSLFTFVPTAANVGYYLDIVRDKYVLRQIIATVTETARRAYEEQADVAKIVEFAAQRIESLPGRNGRNDLPAATSLIALAEMKPEIFDADNLLGNRFLCNEGGMLEVGPSGIGKSSA